MNVNDITKEVLRLAQENPDFVYRSRAIHGCTYLRESDGQLVGDCIFGQALVNLGFDKNILERADENLALGGGYTISSILADNGVAGVDDDGLMLAFNCVQESQDDGVTWGKAIMPLLDM